MGLKLGSITITFDPWPPHVPQVSIQVNPIHGALVPNGDIGFSESLMEGLKQYASALKKSIDTDTGV